jgi:hypothetical protein
MIDHWKVKHWILVNLTCRAFLLDPASSQALIQTLVNKSYLFTPLFTLERPSRGMARLCKASSVIEDIP